MSRWGPPPAAKPEPERRAAVNVNVNAYTLPLQSGGI